MLKKELLTTDLFGSQTSQIILKFLKIESDCQFFSQQCALCVICVLSVSPMSVCYLCHLCRLCLCAICLSYVCHLCIICVICVNCVQCVSSMSSVSPVSVSVSPVSDQPLAHPPHQAAEDTGWHQGQAHHLFSAIYLCSREDCGNESEHF